MQNLTYKYIKTEFKIASIMFPFEALFMVCKYQINYEGEVLQTLMQAQCIYPDKIHQNVFFYENTGETS